MENTMENMDTLAPASDTPAGIASITEAKPSPEENMIEEPVENAIEVRDLKICYRSFKKLSIKSSLFQFGKNKTEVYEALHGVSFDVKKGQIMGIIGRNGSGKSTLLRALAGIFSADEGTIDLKGHSISLLALGVGFQKKLTGRENIMLVGMLLGFSEQTLHERMKEIISFADLGEFIDKPVSTYSSGMYSKLAFAITVVLETEIMLIDEVLSVGDVAFKRKSFAKMKELISDQNRTVVIVSHSLSSLKKLCDSILWLHEGNVMMQGPTEEVLAEYKKFMGVGKKRKRKKKRRVVENE